MKNIVILGCENSHANTFLNFIRDKEEYADVRVIGVYSDDKDASAYLAKTYGVPVLNTYDEAVGKVDGIIVTARHGDNHYKFAKPYIKTGVPMFIDKPITVSEADALEFMRECKENGVRVTGGSTCIHAEWVQTLKKEREEEADGKTLGGFVRCPVWINSPFAGFFFYSQHLVEVVAHIFGRYPLSVKSYLNDKKLTVTFRYADYDVIGLFTDENYSCYYAMRVSENHVKGEEFPITSESPCFLIEFDEFYKLLCGEKQKISYEDFIAPVYIMNAIKRSMDSGKEEKVLTYEV